MRVPHSGVLVGGLLAMTRGSCVTLDKQKPLTAVSGPSRQCPLPTLITSFCYIAQVRLGLSTSTSGPLGVTSWSLMQTSWVVFFCTFKDSLLT